MSVPIAVGLLAATVSLTTPVLVFSGQLDAEARAGGAADAAALAAADALGGWIDGAPCDRALTVTAANQVVLTGCDATETNGQVRISVSVQTMLGTVEAHARAGPVVP